MEARLGEREKRARGERERERMRGERGGEGLTWIGEAEASGSGERETRCEAGWSGGRKRAEGTPCGNRRGFLDPKMASATDPLGWGRRLRSAMVNALGVSRKGADGREGRGMEGNGGRGAMPK